MTRDEAYQEMLAGKKISHNYFTADEYYHLKDGKIFAEDGVNHTSVFWDKDFMKDGWLPWFEPYTPEVSVHSMNC